MISLDIPGVGQVDFPEDMTDEEIRQAIETEILPQARETRSEFDDYWSGRRTEEEERPSWLGNVALGAGERGLEITGGLMRSIGQVAEEGGDWLERRVPLGTVGSPGTPMTEEQISATTNPLTPLADALAQTKLGYEPRTTFEDVKGNWLNAPAFAAEQGLRSIPDMVASVLNPVGYAAARAGEIGQTRAENDGRESATVADILAAAPAATASALLERYSTRGVLGALEGQGVRSMSQLPREMGRAAVREAGTEALQETSDYLGETLGTERGSTAGEAAERALMGAVAGAPFGGGVRGLTGSIQVWANSRGIEPTQDNLEAAAEAGDPEALDILRSAGLSEEQVAGLSPERAAMFVARINARRLADAERGAPDTIFPATDRPPVAAPDTNTERGAQAFAKAQAERLDREIERERLEREGVSAGTIDPAAVSRRPSRVLTTPPPPTEPPVVTRARARVADILALPADQHTPELADEYLRMKGVIEEFETANRPPEPTRLGDRELGRRMNVGTSPDVGLERAVELRGRSNLPANITPPYRPHTDEEVAHQQRVMAMDSAARQQEALARQRAAMTPQPASVPGDVGAEGPLRPVTPNLLLGSEERQPQTFEQNQDQQRTERDFRLAEHLAGRAGDTVRDVRAGGRPEGGIESQQTVYLDEGRPVQVVGSRTETRRDGTSQTFFTVHRFDPRTGQPVPDEDGEVFEYEIEAERLKEGRYAVDPRRAQEMEQAAVPPIVGGYKDAQGRTIRPSAAGTRADELQGLPRQTYRTTEPDPTVPGAEGPTSEVPGQGPVPRAPRPEQGAGPRFDQGSNKRPGEMRGDQTYAETRGRAKAQAEAEAERRRRMWEEAQQDRRQDDQGQQTDWGKAKSKYENQREGYSSNFAGPDPDGWPQTDDDGFVLSDKGGPIRFSEKGVVIKVLKALRQQFPDAGLDLAIHPGPMKPTKNGGAEGYWTIQATQPKPAREEAAPEHEAAAEGAAAPFGLPSPTPAGDTETVPEDDTETAPNGTAGRIREGDVVGIPGVGPYYDRDRVSGVVKSFDPETGLYEIEVEQGGTYRSQTWRLPADRLEPSSPAGADTGPAPNFTERKVREGTGKEPGRRGAERGAPFTAPRPDTETVPPADRPFDPDAPENAERTRRLRAVADRYEVIGNEEKAAWFRDKAGKAPKPTVTGKGTTDNLDGWERMVKLDEEKAVGLHTVSQPPKRGPRAPKLIDDIDDELIDTGEGKQSTENIAEGRKHVPDHIRRKATDRINDLRRLRAERGYDGNDEPPGYMTPWAIGQIDRRIGELDGAYNRYVRFLGAFKLGRNAAKPTKDGKREKVYTAETVGRELKKLQEQIDRPMPTDAELELDLAGWSIFQLDNHAEKYGAASEDGSRAVAELRSRGWGNRRPNEVIKERRAIIKKLNASPPPANYAELERQAADLEEDLARDPDWQSVRRNFNRQTGKLENMTPRQIAAMLREDAEGHRAEADRLKTKKAKENALELARSADYQAQRIEDRIPGNDTETVSEDDTETAPNFIERKVREGGGREPGRRPAERGAPFRVDRPGTETVPESDTEKAPSLAGERLVGAVEKALRERRAKPNPKAVAKLLDVPEADAGRALASIAARGATVIRQNGQGGYRLTPQSDQPMSLLEFLMSKGGLRRDGDLVAMDAHRKTHPRYGMLVRKEGGGGLSLDEARELAESEGYIGQGTDDYNTTTIPDLLEAIEGELRGNRVTADRAGDESPRGQMERMAERLGIDLRDDWTDAELEAEIDERLGIMGDSVESAADAEANQEFVDAMLAEMGIAPDDIRGDFNIPFGDEQGSRDEGIGRGAAEGGAPAEGDGGRAAEGAADEAPDVPEAARPGAEDARQGQGPDREGARRPPRVERTDQGDQFVLGDEVAQRTKPEKMQGKGAQKRADEGMFAAPKASGPEPRQIDLEEAVAASRIEPIDPANVPDPVNGKPIPAGVKPEERLLLISCGIDKDKAPGLLPAIARYAGPRFQDIRKWLARNPGEAPKIVILSGKYDFIDGKEPIPDYDQAMTKDRAGKLIRDGAGRNGALEVAAGPKGGYRDVLIVGGGEYTAPFNAAVTQLVQAGVIRPDAAVNRSKGAIGIQRQQMVRWLGKDGVPEGGTDAAPKSDTETVPKPDTEAAPEGAADERLERLRDQARVFASGMSAPQELEAGLQAWSGLETRGIGVEIGRLSNRGIDTLAKAVVDRNAAVFVDSGAYGLGMAEQRGAGGFDDLLGAEGPVKMKPLDFDEVLAKYDRILDRIAALNGTDGDGTRDMDADGDLDPEEAGRLYEDDQMGRGAETDTQPVLFVMPDVVMDQAGSLALVERYRDHIRRHVLMGVSLPIVPIQKGELSLAEAYGRIADTLGTEEFVVGIPAAARAVGDAELREFLAEVRPARIHILGGASPGTLDPKLKIIADVGLEPEHLSADANILRAALWGSQDAGVDRRTAVRDTLVKRAGKEFDEQVNGPAKGTETVPKRGTQRDVDGILVVATGDPDKPWAGGRYVEKGSQAGWQPDTALGFGETPEAAAEVVQANRRRADIEQKDRAEANSQREDAVARARRGERLDRDTLKALTKYGDGKVTTTAAKAFLASMGLNTKQANDAVARTGSIDKTEGGAWLYDLDRIIRAGQNTLGVGEGIRTIEVGDRRYGINEHNQVRYTPDWTPAVIGMAPGETYLTFNEGAADGDYDFREGSRVRNPKGLVSVRFNQGTWTAQYDGYAESGAYTAGDPESIAKALDWLAQDSRKRPGQRGAAAEPAPKPSTVAGEVRAIMDARAAVEAGTATELQREIVQVADELRRRRADKTRLAEKARVAKARWKSGPQDLRMLGGLSQTARDKDNTAIDRDANQAEIKRLDTKLKELLARAAGKTSRGRVSIFDRMRDLRKPVELTAQEEAAVDAEWRQQLEELAPRIENAADARRVLAENVGLGILDKGTADGISRILDRLPTNGLKGMRLVVQDRLAPHEIDILGTDRRAGGEFITFADDPDLRILVVQGRNGSRDAVKSFVHENAHSLFDVISAEDRAKARRIYDGLRVSRQAMHTVNYGKAERFEEWFAESMVDYYTDQNIARGGRRPGVLWAIEDTVRRVYKRIVDVFSNEKGQIDAFFRGLEYGLGRGEGADRPGTATRRARRGTDPFAILTKPVTMLTGEPRAWRAGMKEAARDAIEIWRNRGKRANRQSFIGGLARAYFYSADGEFRSAIGRFNSPTMDLLANTFHAQAGSGHWVDPDLAKKLGMKLSSNATFDEAVTRRASVELQHLDRILRPFREDQAAMDRIVTLVQEPGRRRGGPESDAASQVARMLAGLHKYMVDSGVDLGQVKQGYFPREIDPAAVIRDAQGFLEAATKAYKASGLNAKEAREAAEHWQTNVLYGGDGSPVRKGGGNTPSFVQSRVLTKQADQILKDFYQRDPDLILGSYINRAVKRAEIARRFGDNWKNWGEIEAQIRKEDPAAGGMFDHLRSYAATAAGVQQHNVHGLIRSGSSLVRTFTTLSLLEKSTFASLAEAITPMLRSGSVADFFPSLTKTLNELRREIRDMPPSAAAELAADVGAIAGSGVNSIMAARFAGGDPLGRAQARILSSYFRRIGLEQWTNATRVASAERAAVFIRRLARDIVGNGLNPKSARLYMEELGIDPKRLDEFVAFVNRFGDQLPSPAQLADAGPMGEMYRTAVLRFVDQTIMRPSTTTRPRWASHPIGAVAFQLQAFTYAFSKNVLGRAGRLAKRAVTEEDLTAVDRALLLAPLAMLPALAMTQALVGELRDWLFMDPERKAAETRAAKIEKAISRAGLTGILDPYIQMMSGARYSKDPVSTLTGPFLGIFGQGIGAGIQWIANNSPNTNAADRKAVEALYDVLVEPSVNMGLGFAPVAPLTALMTWGVLPAMRDEFVDSLAGERRGHKQQPVYGLTELLAGRQFAAKGSGWGEWAAR